MCKQKLNCNTKVVQDSCTVDQCCTWHFQAFTFKLNCARKTPTYQKRSEVGWFEPLRVKKWPLL